MVTWTGNLQLPVQVPIQQQSFLTFILRDGSWFLTRMGESWRLETVTDMIRHAKVVCNQSNRIDGFNMFVGKHQWSGKDPKEMLPNELHTAICCKLELSWIIQRELQVRINRSESSTVITLILPWIIYKRGITTMFTPKLHKSKRHQSFPIYCPWKRRVKHISNSFAFQHDAKVKLYMYIIQICSQL